MRKVVALGIFLNCCVAPFAFSLIFRLNQHLYIPDTSLVIFLDTLDDVRD